MTNLKLVGSRITKINAERKPDFEGKLEMKTDIRIISLEKIKEAKDTAKLSYAFKIDYGELGGIEIEGNLFLSGDAKEIKELLKIQKDKKYDTPEFIGITNLIIQKASIKVFGLEEELGLPIHIRLPTVSPKK